MDGRGVGYCVAIEREKVCCGMRCWGLYTEVERVIVSLPF